MRTYLKVEKYPLKYHKGQLLTYFFYLNIKIFTFNIIQDELIIIYIGIFTIL